VGESDYNRDSDSGERKARPDDSHATHGVTGVNTFLPSFNPAVPRRGGQAGLLQFGRIAADVRGWTRSTRLALRLAEPMSRARAPFGLKTAKSWPRVTGSSQPCDTPDMCDPYDTIGLPAASLRPGALLLAESHRAL
jgi:hypothetical protein